MSKLNYSSISCFKEQPSNKVRYLVERNLDKLINLVSFMIMQEHQINLRVHEHLADKAESDQSAQVHFAVRWVKDHSTDIKFVEIFGQDHSVGFGEHFKDRVPNCGNNRIPRQKFILHSLDDRYFGPGGNQEQHQKYYRVFKFDKSYVLEQLRTWKPYWRIG